VIYAKQGLICVLCGNEFSGYPERPYCDKHQMVPAEGGGVRALTEPDKPSGAGDKAKYGACVICGTEFEIRSRFVGDLMWPYKTCGAHRVDLRKSRAVAHRRRTYPIPALRSRVWCASKALHSVSRGDEGTVIRHYPRGFSVRFGDNTLDFNEVEWALVSREPVIVDAVTT